METIEEKVPPVNLGEVHRWRTKLNDILLPFVGETIVADTFTNLVAQVTSLFNAAKHDIPKDMGILDHNVIYPAVKDTLSGLIAGRFMSMVEVDRISAVIAGNVQTLTSALAVPVWAGQCKPEWSLAMIKSARFMRTPKRHIPGANVEYSILTGTAAGLTLEQFMTEGALHRLAERLTITKKFERRMLHPRELVRTFIMLKLKPGLKLEAEKYMEKDSLNKRNKSRMEQRAAFKETCPVESKFPCHFCPVGFTTCKQGTHKSDYVKHQCVNGHIGYFDPHLTKTSCLYCEAQAWKRRT